MVNPQKLVGLRVGGVREFEEERRRLEAVAFRTSAFCEDRVEVVWIQVVLACVVAAPVLQGGEAWLHNKAGESATLAGHCRPFQSDKIWSLVSEHLDNCWRSRVLVEFDAILSVPDDHIFHRHVVLALCGRRAFEGATELSLLRNKGTWSPL